MIVVMHSSRGMPARIATDELTEKKVDKEKPSQTSQSTQAIFNEAFSK